MLLSVVVPVLQEKANIAPLVEGLETALAGLDWEVIFVDDDSLDGTADECRTIAKRHNRVRVIQRIGRHGLSSACVEGMLSSHADYLAVMDGDLQHDERLLPQMLALAGALDADLVVASRYAPGGGAAGFSDNRLRLSQLGAMLGRAVLPRRISDPMSGYFLIRRSRFAAVVHDLSQVGFKILLDIIVSSGENIRIAELPFQFRARRFGDSKLDTRVTLDYLLLLADKVVGHLLPPALLLYAVVGLSGLGVHLMVLWTLQTVRGENLLLHQATATYAAVLCNFFLNNAITYRDRRLTNWRSILKGVVVYGISCGVGALANLGLTNLLAERGWPWLTAGAAGMGVSGLWNYAMATAFTWKVAQRRRAFLGQLRRKGKQASTSAI